MKKTPIFLLAASMLSVMLTGCGGNDGNDTAPSVTTEESSQVEQTETSTEAKEDFTVQPSCPGGFFDQEAYVFSTVDKNDEPWMGFWNPEVRVNINAKDWSYVTALNEKKTVISSEKEEVLPVSAVTVTPEVSSQSGLLESILLTIDRAAVKVGTTHLKVHFENANGATSATPIDLCVPVEIKEFGTLEAPTVKATFTLDLGRLDSKYDNLPTNFCVQDDDHVYGEPHKTVTEYPVSGKEVTVENVTLPLNHALYFFVRMELENGRFETKALTLESDSSFSVENDGIHFESAPSGEIRASIA